MKIPRDAGGTICSVKLLRNGRFLAIAATGLCAGLVLAGCSSNSPSSGSAPVAQISRLGPTSAYNGITLTKSYALPTGSFTTTDGGTRSITAPAKGDLTLVFFGFTHCSDDCPTIMAEVAAGWRALPTADQKRINLDFVTTDPWRDTPAVMKTWLARFGLPPNVGMTAAWQVIHDSGAAVGVDVEKPASFAGNYQVTHGLQLLGYTSDGQAHIEWLTEQITRPQLTADFARILSGAPIK